MKRAFGLFLQFCVTALILCGCSADHTPAPRGQAVTSVDIACRQEHMLIRRHYTTPEKMQSVLLYLRLLDSEGPSDTDPERIDADVYQITVHLSDGNRRIYRQKAHRYFCRGTQPWQMIDPAHAAKLYTLMRQFPSDRQL